MNNKEKCKILKEIRKETAEKIGVELNQIECTYKGECSGTCPKCRQEEEKLNKALLGGKVAAVALASSLALAGCTTDTLSGNVEVKETTVDDIVMGEFTEESILGTTEESTEDIKINISPDVDKLSGAVEPVSSFHNFLK